jgi:NADH-quinone oxidoreductase subunit C
MPYPMVGEERLEVVRIREHFGDALLKVKEFRGETYLCVDRNAIREIATYLKEDPELAYVYFVECLGADYSRWEHERDLTGRFEVIYNLMSIKNSSRILLKVSVDDGHTVPSLVPVFMGAEYPEREVQDLFGIIFEGNGPRPGERFLLPDDWTGYPLRKEYPLGGEDVLFDGGSHGPAIEDLQMPHAGESFVGRTGSSDVSGR